MGFWNVTYNDSSRWEAVESIAGPRIPFWRGIRETLAGRPLGSPRVNLVRIDGLEDLQAERLENGERSAINFLRTQSGFIAFTKIRLEVYAIPFQHDEWCMQTEPADGVEQLLKFNRKNQCIQFHVEASASAFDELKNWLNRFSQIDQTNG